MACVMPVGHASAWRKHQPVHVAPSAAFTVIRLMSPNIGFCTMFVPLFVISVSLPFCIVYMLLLYSDKSTPINGASETVKAAALSPTCNGLVGMCPTMP